MPFQLFAHPPSLPLNLPERLEGYFILPQDIPAYAEQGQYNHWLILLSYIVVVISAYVALGIASKLQKSPDRSQRIKLTCGAFAMGAGIWSMHFIGMLAYEMKMLVSYDPWITGLSMLVAVAFAGAAFGVIRGEKLTTRTIVYAAPLLGFAVCGMHYIGMQAMQMDAKLLYKPDLFLLSFIIATSASAAALKIIYHARNSEYPVVYKVLAAMVMGIAVCGMHYTGMWASVFLPYANCRYAADQDFSGMATSIALITFLIVFIAYLVKQLDDAVMEIQERTAQLIQAQKMEAVGQLTGGISHDFNNMLAVILGNLELLSRLPSMPARADLFIKTALESGMKARDLTQRLLAFSRKQVLQPVPTDLATLIPSALELAKRAMGPDIKIKSFIADNLPIVRIDQVHLESALLNLALNARDAMPAGGTLAVEAKAIDITNSRAKNLQFLPGKYVALSVRDTGTGMSSEVMERAMEPFFTTKDVGKGSGMGLSMVFGFARQSGGNVMLESTLNVGTLVTIYLPVSTEPLPASNEHPSHEDIIQGHQKVLIVDDEKELRSYMETALSDAGYGVYTAASAKEALQILQEGKDIDVMVTDVLMPTMNGYKLAEEASKLRPGLKILFISGYTQQEKLPSFLSPKDCAFLAKPFTLNLLTQAIQKICTNRK